MVTVTDWIKSFEKDPPNNIVNTIKTITSRSTYYELIDNLFYNLDPEKLDSDVAISLLEETEKIKDKFLMRKYFLDKCKQRYSRHQDVRNILRSFTY